MKKTLVLAFLIIIGFFITDRLAYSGLRYLDKNVFTGQTTGKANQFLSLKDTVNTLVFGSSRANHHVVINELDSSGFNMGLNATKIAFATTLINTLNKKNQNIFVHIDQNSLLNASESYDGGDCLGLINHASSNKAIREVLNELFPEEIIITHFSNSYMYNGKVLGTIKNYFYPSYNYKKYNGFDAIVPSANQKKVFLSLWNSKGRDSIGYHENIAVNSLMTSLIEKIHKKCLENQSTLIFFTSPTLNQINPELVAKTQQFFKSKNITYLDYTSLFKEFNPDYWKDLTHLSETGAKEFTKKLKEDFLIHTKSAGK